MRNFKVIGKISTIISVSDGDNYVSVSDEDKKGEHKSEDLDDDQDEYQIFDSTCAECQDSESNQLVTVYIKPEKEPIRSDKNRCIEYLKEQQDCREREKFKVLI